MNMCLNFAAFGFILEIDDLFTRSNFYIRIKDQYSLFSDHKLTLRRYYEMGSLMVFVPDRCKPKNAKAAAVLNFIKPHVVVLGYCLLMANPFEVGRQAEAFFNDGGWFWY